MRCARSSRNRGDRVKNSVSSALPTPAIAIPRSAAELDVGGLSHGLRMLTTSRLFWVGLAIKICCAALFGSHVTTKWFAPFAYEFVHSHFRDPWTTFLLRGEPLAFPYGPGMLALLSLPFAPAYFVSFDPSSHFGLVLARIPLLAADLAICALLMRWLKMHARDVVMAYWLSPIVLYASYIHGQLDLIPTALLCISLYLMFSRKLTAAALVMGFGLATKAHLLIALPFVAVYLIRQRRARLWIKFTTLTILVAAALYTLPMTSQAFRTTVLGSPEAGKLWAVQIPYGIPGLSLYVAPAAIAIALLRFAAYRKVNRELTMMFIGALYVGLVAIVPPQPGWFIWSLPFVAYLWARFAAAGRYVLGMMSFAYLLYFFVAGPALFLEAADPLLGAGFGARAAADLIGLAPFAFSPHAASVAWTALFATTALTGFEMYRKGVQSNSVYSFRDETFMIGVGGDSGAGKHTIGHDLQRLFGGNQLLQINGDDDHRWERGHQMWRQYTHLDPRGNQLAAQLEALSALRRGHEVRKRHYDHNVGRFTEPVLLKPTDFIAIVGLHPFYLASQRQLLHLKVFVDPDETLRRNWKVARDIQKRGYTEQQVLAQIEQRSADSAKFVQPQKRYADAVIRHRADPASERAINLEIELSTLLDPLSLFDVLNQVPSLRVEWFPDDALTRDTLSIEGELDAAEIALIANAAISNLEDLMATETSPWLPGSRGMVQLVLAFAVSASMRVAAARDGVQ